MMIDDDGDDNDDNDDDDGNDDNAFITCLVILYESYWTFLL